MVFVLVVATLTAVVVTWWWWAGTRGLNGKDLVTARLDGLRVGLSVGVGGGGLFALWLALRRQRSTEADLDNRERALAHQLSVAADSKAHQERVAAAAEKDAEARRITDLYTKAADQLGSEKAPVRLAGLYALGRLAQEHAEQRQTVVNVLCAYLRMPYTLPGETTPSDTSDHNSTSHESRTQERQVRITAQRILCDHIRNFQEKKTRWTNIDLDLTGAVLIDWSMNFSSVRAADFSAVEFIGRVSFLNTTFKDSADFSQARFTDYVDFDMAVFRDVVHFGAANFEKFATFDGTHFIHNANFGGANFRDQVTFNNAKFAGAPGNLETQEDPWTHFGGATFAHEIPTEIQPFLKAVQPPE